MRLSRPLTVVLFLLLAIGPAQPEADIEEQQNERLLTGNTEILKHVVTLEERILQLEQRIMSALDRPA